MSARIEEELRATGVAQVIVVLKQPQENELAGAMRRALVPTARRAAVGASATAVTTVAERMRQYFVASTRSQDAALARAIAVETGRRASQSSGPQASASRSAGAPDEWMAGDPAPAMPSMRVYPNLGIVLGTVNARTYADLQNDPDVASVGAAPDISLIRPIATEQVKAPKDVTWGLRRMRVPELWEANLTGKGVLVGHLDTGVDGSHPALAGAVRHYAEFSLLGKENELPVGKARDTGTHGTHTAGTIAGRPVDDQAFGVAPEATLASAIVIEGGNVIARVLGGMNWAVGKGVRILSMSLGLRGYHGDFLPVTQVLRVRNILPVFAVGNEGPGRSRSPGNYAECLSVGASAVDDTVADFSGSQSFTRPDAPTVPDLVAPGVDVISCVPGGKYAKKSGSSMGTPHVAGLAALLWEAKPDATEDMIEQAILRSCEAPSGMLPERCGLGVPDGPRAFEILTGRPLQGSPVVAAAKARRATRPKRAAAKPKKPAKRKTPVRKRKSA